MNARNTLTALMSAALALSPLAQAQEAGNPSEFTLVQFQDATKGWSFARPGSWTPDPSFKDGVRFVGGDEALEWRVVSSTQTPAQYAGALKLGSGESKIGLKAFKQGSFSAQVRSSKLLGKSAVTGKPLGVLLDRWVFSPAPGKLALLSVQGPDKVFDWEGNRDMALSFRLK